MQQSSIASEILANLHQAFTDALAGQARAVLLEGAAGFGKSHALRTFASVPKGLVLTAEGKNWLTTVLGLCKSQLELERDSAFLEAARRIAPNAGYAQVMQTQDFADQNALWNTIAFALERLAKRVGGLSLLLEDAHNASQDDLGALRAVYRRAMLGHAPVLIVLTTRPTEQDLLEGFAQDAAIANGIEPNRISISSLKEAGVHALAKEHLHSEFLPDNLSAWLYARAEGHPLHTLELLRFLQDGGALQDLGISWVFEPPKGKAIPKNLNAILTARVANAKRDTRAWKALAALSVLERECRLTDWAKLSGQTEQQLLELANRLEYLGLVRENLIAGQTVYAVAHPLYPPLVRAQLEPLELEQLHRNAVNVAANLGERARHALACHHERALEFSEVALEEARGKFAHAEIVEHAQNVLHLTPTELPEIRLLLGESLLELGMAEKVLEVLNNDPSERASLCQIRALALLFKNEEAIELAKQCFDLSLEPERSRFGCELAHLLIRKNAYPEVETLLRSLSPSQDHDLADVMFAWYHYWDHQTKLPKALEALELAETHAQVAKSQSLLASILSNKAGLLAQTERHSESAAVMNEAIEIAKESGLTNLLNIAYHGLGWFFIATGQYAFASEPLAKCLRLASSLKKPNIIANAYTLLSIPAYVRGDLRQGREYLGQSIEMYRDMKHASQLRNMLFYQAWVEASHGFFDVAKTFFASEHASDPDKLHHWHQQASQTYFYMGEFETASQILQQSPIGDYETAGLSEYHYTQGLLHLSTHKLHAALEEVSKAIELSASTNNQTLTSEMRFARAIINLKLQNPAAAQLEANETLEVFERNQGWGHLFPLERQFPEEAQILRSQPPKQSESRPLEPSYLHTLGAFSLERDGKTTPWKASKTRELLAVLLVAYLREGGPKISKTQIIDTLWQDEIGDANTESKFRMTLKRLREALGSAANLENNQGIYELSHLKADVVFFLESLERLDFDAALGWYKDEFLPGIDVPGCEIIRAQLWQRFRDTAIKLSFETPNANLLEKLHQLEPLDVGILERYLQLISGDAFRTQQTLSRAINIFERETGEIPKELAFLVRS